jgi:pilus assembly protein FimV
MNLYGSKWGFHTVLLGLLFSMATSAYGLGLGNLDLQSRLNERFSANIPVIVPAEVDATEITVQLAANSQFERAGLKKTDTVTKLQFSPERKADGQMIIAITTTSRVTEPMVSFVLEVQQGSTRTLRTYNAMLEPVR